MTANSTRFGRKTKLNTKLQRDICRLLAKGATDETACNQVGISKQTFYNWLAKGEAESVNGGEFFDFLDAVTQAKSKAHVVATTAFYAGLQSTIVKETITETFIETRLDKAGNPYEYKKVTEREVERKLPPDWRAGEAWLKRRDKENWSDKTTIEVEDWRSQAIADIREGHLTFQALADAFDDDLATQLFAEAGVSVSTGEGTAAE